MPSEYSIYAIHEAQKPKWLPGEELAASAFIAMTFLLAIEINVAISRAFKRRTGIYYWAMQIGSVACAVDAVGMIPKYLVANPNRVYALYTLLMTVGWATYTVGQLVVLYSRLHLICQSRTVQRSVFYTIVIVSPLLIVADWTVTWPAYNPDPKITDRWSAAQAIVERISQLGFSLLEASINVIYALSLIRLLRLKSNVRQRRVMVDLIYVNALASAFDILNIILVYVNRTDVSHPIQTFSYALKLRLEFVVLNQLMAVAARGLNRETFAEKRYHNLPSLSHNGSIPNQGFKPPEIDVIGSIELHSKDSPNTRDSSVQISTPSPTVSKPSSGSKHEPHDTLQNPSNISTRKHSTRYPLLPSLRTFLARNPPARQDSETHDIFPAKAQQKEKKKKQRLFSNEEEEEEIGLHMWENHHPVLEIPWFRTDDYGRLGV